ncbi:MAG TPA: type II secretion system F family protein, partial [Bacilli bacterium]|nr:type II secretion system F family protein [Bacilli bacterium]
MPQFKYVGRDKNGKVRKGKITESSKQRAVAKLKERAITVSEIEQLSNSGLNMEISFSKKVGLKDLMIFLRQFATLIRAGIPIIQCINILANQTTSTNLKKALFAIETDLENGMSITDAFAKQRKSFPPMVVNLLAAGEATGNIDETLDRLADYFEKQNKTRQKVKSALSYPIIVSIIAIIAVVFLLIKVVPTFASMLEELGGSLPVITRFVLDTSDFIVNYWWFLLLITITFFTILAFLNKKSTSKYYLDYVILKIPLFGKIFQKSVIARMTRTLSSLFSSSVPILQSLSIVERVVENEVVGRVIKNARVSLESGGRLSDPLSDHWIFPPLVTQMIAIGEETGSLDEMLNKVADFYEDDVESTT